MLLLDDILKTLPYLLDDLESQNRTLGIADDSEVFDLLHDETLTRGLPRDWRKAVFRLLDCGFSRILEDHTPTKERLEARAYPFRTYYSRTILLFANDRGKGSDESTRLLEELTKQMKQHSKWRKVDVLARCLSEYDNFWAAFERVSVLIDSDKMNFWLRFINCLRIADQYDVYRTVYQSLDSETILEVCDLTQEQRGHVLDIWQTIIDEQIGNHGDLRRALYRVVKDTCTLPTSMIVRDISLLEERAKLGGGCADIYRAELNGSLVALKVLRMFDEEDIRPLFQELCKEGILWRQLKHDNICPFLGLCTDIFAPRFAMIAPWMPHGDLPTYLRKTPDADRIALVKQIASGLNYLHSQNPQVIHGDLRASNVLVDEERKARISDFGLSVANMVHTKMTVHSGKGSARWQAPELHFVEGGLSHITAESDVYAFGMTCYEIFTGNIPYAHLPSDGVVVLEVCLRKNRLQRPSEPETMERGLDDRIWNLLRHCWEYNPKRRPTMKEIVKGLKRAFRPYVLLKLTECEAQRVINAERITLKLDMNKRRAQFEEEGEETEGQEEGEEEEDLRESHEMRELLTVKNGETIEAPGAPTEQLSLLIPIESDSDLEDEDEDDEDTYKWMFQPPNERPPPTKAMQVSRPSYLQHRPRSFGGYDMAIRFVDGRTGNEIDLSGLMRLRRTVNNMGVSLDPDRSADEPMPEFPQNFDEWMNLANLGSATGLGFLDKPPPSFDGENNNE